MMMSSPPSPQERNRHEKKQGDREKYQEKTQQLISNMFTRGCTVQLYSVRLGHPVNNLQTYFTALTILLAETSTPPYTVVLESDC